MNKNRWMLLLGGAFLILITILMYSQTDDAKKEAQLKAEKKDSWDSGGSSDGSDFSNFPEAPRPEEDVRAEVERLWAHALEPKDPKRKERVQKEWQDFAQKYPKNIYIPNEIRGPLTEAEEKEIIETLDSFTSMEAKFASYIASNKYATPGTEAPDRISEKDADPKEMSKYFEYKVRELESRIELLEYTMEKARLSSVDEAIAKKDIDELKKQLVNLKEMQAQVPRS